MIVWQLRQWPVLNSKAAVKFLKHILLLNRKVTLYNFYFLFSIMLFHISQILQPIFTVVLSIPVTNLYVKILLFAQVIAYFLKSRTRNMRHNSRANKLILKQELSILKRYNNVQHFAFKRLESKIKIRAKGTKSL